MKYKTVVIDPPWDISVTPNTIRNTGYKSRLPYKTMSDDQLLDFPIDNFTTKTCLLFLWIVHSKTQLALDMIKRWGFKYYAPITWYKHGGVCRNGIYADVELCLLAYRGKIRESTNFKNPIKLFVDSPSTTHSEKPNKFYNMLLKSTRVPRIDIFARRRHYGFDAYGDQVEPDTQTRIL